MEKKTGADKDAEQLGQLFDELQQSGEMDLARAKYQLSEDIFEQMEQAGITRADLARRMGVSNAYISKMLRGDTNFTIEQLLRVARALDCKMTLPRFEPPKRKATGVSVERNVPRERRGTRPTYGKSAR